MIINFMFVLLYVQFKLTVNRWLKDMPYGLPASTPAERDFWSKLETNHNDVGNISKLKRNGIFINALVSVKIGFFTWQLWARYYLGLKHTNYLIKLQLKRDMYLWKKYLKQIIESF